MNRQFKILLATDLSAASLNAEKYAFKLAQETNSFLLVMHVQNINSTGGIADKMRALHRHVFMQTIAGNLMNEPVDYECLIREGIAFKQICREASELDVDFIIAGSIGDGDSTNPLGTQVRELILNGKIPVISVPPKATFEKIKRVSFVTTNKESELPVINYLSKFCRTFDAELSILHLSSMQMSPEFAKRSQQQFLSEIKRKISYPNINLLTYHLNDLSGGLNAYCIESKTDLLVMSPERPTVFDKVYNGYLDPEGTYIHTTVPLFTIPDFYSPDYSWFWRSIVPEHSL